jgi:hypothetical protein
VIKVQLEDSDRSGIGAQVTDEGNLNVIVAPKPPSNGSLMQPVAKNFTNSSGSTDMRVSASVASPVDFSVDAEADFDVYIKSINILISDAGATLNQFGAISALTNGVQFIWKTQDKGELIIIPDLKSNYDFIQLAGGNPAFGDGNSAFRGNNVIGTSEAYLQRVDLGAIFGLQWGLKLRKNTNDKIVFRVRDNTSAIDGFEMSAYGAKI